MSNNSHSSGQFGTLYIVSTPIGNLGDLSPRAVKILKEVNCVLAEDTRVFSKLKQTFEIDSQSKSFFTGNEYKKTDLVINLLKDGENIAIVSDAGTPTINDPGYLLVKKCREEGLKVIPIPGPSSPIAALSVSGLETECFHYWGFLPHKKGQRKKLLENAKEIKGSSIFLESPYRIISTLEITSEIDPNWQIFIAREMTKIHEEYNYSVASEALEQYLKKDKVKGEVVLIVSGAKK